VKVEPVLKMNLTAERRMVVHIIPQLNVHLMVNVLKTILLVKKSTKPLHFLMDVLLSHHISAAMVHVQLDLKTVLLLRNALILLQFIVQMEVVHLLYTNFLLKENVLLTRYCALITHAKNHGTNVQRLMIVQSKLHSNVLITHVNQYLSPTLV